MTTKVYINDVLVFPGPLVEFGGVRNIATATSQDFPALREFEYTGEIVYWALFFDGTKKYYKNMSQGEDAYYLAGEIKCPAWA